MKLFGGPKKPRRLFRLNKFGAESHIEEYNERKLRVGSVFRYTHMPEILPRIRALGQKFGHFAFMLALVFRSARLFPAGHVMLNPNNIGRYGIRDVIATAANNLVMKKENIDQIVVFGAVVMSLIMVAIQAVLIVFYAFMNPAQASGMFETPDKQQDYVFEFSRHVFGVDTIFGKMAAEHAQPGLHAILGFYSTAMMIVASLIVVYYVIVVVGEAAQSGKPFGGRFNSLWAPVRLVLALGLLVPLGGGLNSAQYIVLYLAKMGSGFATQGWIAYTKNFNPISSTPLSVANAPNVSQLVKMVFESEACRATWRKVQSGQLPVRIAAVYQDKDGNIGSFIPKFSAYDVTNAVQKKAVTLKYVWTNEGNVKNPSPLCGGITFNFKTVNKIDFGGADQLQKQANQIAEDILVHYAILIGRTINAVSGNDPSVASDGAEKPGTASYEFAQLYTTSNDTGVDKSTFNEENIAAKVSTAIDTAQRQTNAEIRTKTIDTTVKTDVIKKMRDDASARGWGSAGVYYLEMSKASQAISNAVNSTGPSPLTIDQGALNSKTGSASGFTTLSAGIWCMGNCPAATEADKEVIAALGHLPTIRDKSSGSVPATNYDGRPQLVPIGNADVLAEHIDKDLPGKVVKWLFGDAFIRLLDRPTLSPMETLIQGGSDVLQRSFSMVDLFLVAKMAELIPVVGGLAGAFSGILWFLITIGAAVGIVLFYVLPMMPFMYFFFSVVNWVIEVMEAFISMPLFALAHLRIDGDGLPGQAAMSGYMTLFGVFLRPILIILGLIIGSLIFGAGSFYLAQIYKSAVFSHQIGATGDIDFSKLSGFDITIYMILFVYIIYLLANATFKLIDKIPDEAMRWIGGGRGFTGDRPVDLGNMQGMALAGYAGIKEGQQALSGGISAVRQGGTEPLAKVPGAMRAKREAARKEAQAKKDTERRHQEQLRATRGESGDE